MSCKRAYAQQSPSKAKRKEGEQQEQVSFQWKNPEFPILKNPDVLLRNRDFRLKNVDCTMKTGA